MSDTDKPDYPTEPAVDVSQLRPPPGGMAREYQWTGLMKMIVVWDGDCWRGPGGGAYTAWHCLAYGEPVALPTEDTDG